MKKELDEKLCQTFPLLYADRHASMQDTCMCWGFDVGDGWYDVIYGLSFQLERLIRELPENDRQHYRAAQVKEKFGGLRFYMTGSTDEMEVFISEAETLCWKLCEKCGAPGKQRGGGWIRTLCDSHASGDKG